MSGTDHLCLQQQLPKITRKTLASSSKNREVKQQEKKRKTTATRKEIAKLFMLHANAKNVSFCLFCPTFCSLLLAHWFFTGRKLCLTIPTVQEFNSLQEFINLNLGGRR